MISRRAMLGGATASALLNGAPAKQRPNILFLFTDDQRFSTLNAINNPEVKTPNMDRLIKQGVTFDHASIMGGTIGAVCAPSRAMLMTGQTLFHIHNSIIEPKPDPRPFDLFPEHLRKNGYTTFATGKWHNGAKLHARCFSAGENIFFGGMSDHDKVPVNDFDPTGAYPESKRYTAKGFSSTLFANSAIKFIQNQKPDNPFLAYVAFTAPHDPRMAPDKYTAMYPPEKITLPKNFLPMHPFDNGEMKVRDEMLAGHPRTEKEVREHIAGYYAMITEVDEEIGRVLDALEKSPHAKNTIVIFAADNGLAVGQHGLMGKQNLYDHSIRVPLVIGGPGLPKGQRRDTLCYLLDLFPTICELTGLPIPTTVEGTSLLPAIKSPKVRVRASSLHVYRNVQRALRTETHKLIVYTVNGVETVQLFDLRADPLEMNNLAAQPAQAKLVADLRAQLVTWQKRTHDPLVSN